MAVQRINFIKASFLVIILVLGLFFSIHLTKKEAEKKYDPFTQRLNSKTSFVTLKELKENKIVLLYFGFLSCPDACPTTLSLMARVFKDLPKSRLDKISFVFVDLDPERDTMNRLYDYTSFFHPKILPVTLPLEDLNLFTKFFGISFNKVPLKSEMKYTIDHSTDIVVLAPNGEVLQSLPHYLPKYIVLSKLNTLIDQYFQVSSNKK